MWKKITKIGKKVFLVLLVLGFIGAIIDVSNSNEADSSVKSTKSKQDKVEDYSCKTNLREDDPIIKVANEKFGKDIVEINKDEGVLTMVIDKSNAPTVRGLRFSVEVETEGILKEVAKSEDVELLHIEFLGSFIDKYGNTGIDTLAWYEFSRETIEKINFTNFNPKNIGLIADSYFEHPAFQKK